MTIDLINNAALLLAICWLQSLISNRWDKGKFKAQVMSGIVFSLATVTVMITAILIEPGLWLWTDSSMVVVGVSTLFYGPVAGGIATLTGIFYKLWIGGIASPAAVINLLISFAAGMAFRNIVKNTAIIPNWTNLLLFGFLIHAVGAGQFYYFHIPPGSDASTSYFLTLLAIMAPTTVLLGLQLQYIERKCALEKQIKENERRLKHITQSIPDQLIITDESGTLSDVITPAILAEQLKDKLGTGIESIDPEAYRNHYALMINKALNTGETQTDVYAANRRHLLGEASDGETFHFESRARKITGSDKGNEVIVLTRDITERVKAEEEIHFLAHFDTLTGLPNRHKANLTISRHIENNEALTVPFAVIIFYLNDFNLFNQSLGADAGDFLLCEISRKLYEAFGKEYFLARYSGLEFMIVKTGEIDTESLNLICRKIHILLEQPINFEGALLRIGASIGTAAFPADSNNKNDLLRKASLALQFARDDKTLQIVHFDAAMDSTFQEMLDIRKSLTLALENRELEVHYQPFYTFDNAIYGIEALIRWSHPQLGMQDPGFFLKAAERSGLITAIGAWGIEKACQHAREMESSGLGTITISVNISLIQLADCEFPNLIREILNKTGLAPNNLILEISEPEIIKNLSNIFQTTRSLANMGVRLAIDNFGSGFTNLSLIKEMGIRYLKIHRDYIRDITDNIEKKSIVTALVQIAKSLEIKTIAVGVEDEKTRDTLVQMGVDMGQGYYYCKPLPKDELIKTMRER